MAYKMNFLWHTKETKFDLYICHWLTKEHLCGTQRVNPTLTSKGLCHYNIYCVKFFHAD